MEAKEPSANVTNVGNSLLVPSVQELAKENLTSVPARYVRPELDTPTVLDTASLARVPVIDMQKLVADTGDNVTMNSEMEKLHLACKDWGFFQLINHGVSNDLVENLKKEVQELFNLSMEEKKKLWQKPGEIEGFGQNFVVSEEQKLEWADIFQLTTLPTNIRNHNLFSKLPHALRDTMEAYSAEVRALALKLLNTMAIALKMEGDDMKELFGEGWQIMRMNYYPPCPQPERAIGLNAHSDGSGISVLLQLNEVDGLQIKKDGAWVPVKPLPNAFIINIGDILEIASNGIYRSIEHRATVNREKERLSVATNLTIKFDGEIGPAPSLITPSTPALFRRITIIDYYKGLFARELNGKSYLDTMRIHQDDEDGDTKGIII